MYKVTVGKDIEMYEMMNSTKKRLFCTNSYRVFRKIKEAEDKICDDFNISHEDIIIITEIATSGTVKLTVQLTIGKEDYTFFDTSAPYYDNDTEEDFLSALDKALSNLETEIDKKLKTVTTTEYFNNLMSKEKIDYWQRVDKFNIRVMKGCYITTLFVPESITVLTDHIKADIDKKISNIKSLENLFDIGDYTDNLNQRFVIKLAQLYGVHPILDLMTIKNCDKRKSLQLRWEFHNKETGEKMDTVYPSILYDADVSIRDILEYEYILAHESVEQDLDDFMND